MLIALKDSMKTAQAIEIVNLQVSVDGLATLNFHPEIFGLDIVNCDHSEVKIRILRNHITDLMLSTMEAGREPAGTLEYNGNIKKTILLKSAVPSNSHVILKCIYK